MPRSPQITAFHARLRRTRPARMFVVAHRGVPAGTIAENTVAAARLALASGADVVEIDATVTRDGAVLAHHDGTEPERLGIGRNVRDLTAAEAARYPHLASRYAGEPMRLPLLADVVRAVLAVSGALVHVDRAWFAWDAVLGALDAVGSAERIVLKAPARAQCWAPVAAYPVAYPAIAIVRSLAEVEAMLALDVAWVGMEFVAASDDDELAQPEAFAAVHERGLPVLVNAENLDRGPSLFAGLDDHAAIGDAGAAWGRMRALGADDIQTDVPWLLDRYRRAQLAG